MSELRPIVRFGSVVAVTTFALTAAGCGPRMSEEAQSADLPSTQPSNLPETTTTPEATTADVESAVDSARAIVGAAYTNEGLVNPYADTVAGSSDALPLVTTMQAALAKDQAADALTVINQQFGTAIIDQARMNDASVEALFGELTASNKFIDVTGPLFASVQERGDHLALDYMPGGLIIITKPLPGVASGSLGITDQYDGSARIAEASILGSEDGQYVKVSDMLDNYSAMQGRVAHILAPKPQAAVSAQPSPSTPVSTCIPKGAQNNNGIGPGFAGPNTGEQLPATPGMDGSATPLPYIPCETADPTKTPKPTPESDEPNKKTLTKGWLQAVNQEYASAQALLERRVKNQKKGSKLAVNLDIDDTSMQTTFAPGEPIKAAQRYVKYAHNHGVFVVFNTARPNKQHAKTDAELTKLFDVDKLCTKGPNETVVASKYDCRRDVIDAGYSIVQNIGNQETDFTGRGFEVRIKLPDTYKGVALK